jgi:hypothetical protein
MKSNMTVTMNNATHHRKASVVTSILLGGGLSLVPGVADAETLPFGDLLPFPASDHISMEMDSAEDASSPTDMEEHAGSSATGISKVAKAYLDYTFFSRRTENLGQSLQGRLSAANQTDFLLSPSTQFRVDNTGWRDPANNEDIFDYWNREGLSASLEWRLDAPGFADKPAFDNLTWGDVLQISFFADYGKTFTNGASSMENSPRRELSSVGIGTGLRFSLPGRLTANLKALSGVFLGSERDGDE